MVYMGSKRKYAKDIVPIINNYIKNNQVENFYDVFCGGANLVDKIICNNLYASDLSPTLIALHQKVQNKPEIIPNTGNREWWDEAYTEYKRLRKMYNCNEWKQYTNIPLWKIGAIEWYSSFSNGGFPRGYAKPSYNRDYYNEAYRNHQKQALEENYKKIIFTQSDYKDLTFKPNSVIYCDSPL